ncbi:ribonuclease VapC [Betaproteobacteria bacterium]|nr:ribonuclease VapC [Betaproteobacteria bacterium]GHT95283.1 ribonuclease VapC [Betaproteobacteria bacterium]GHU18037.1 ribonuclease VapC [Betaproteobacteria bacterium]GHU22915.1 ribonuclease VapC [Betaproteobacteria bacterium]GHU27464.1 ribonuclease VapC [Betaproteobacteria bacterium]
MLKYMLDTNICIYLIREKPPSVIEKFATLRKGEIAISAVTWGELCCGLNTKNSQAQMDALLAKLEPVAYDNDAAYAFGMLSQRFPDRRSSFDRMIAAHAISLGVTLVTNNTADFDLYQDAGLRLENWVTVPDA